MIGPIMEKYLFSEELMVPADNVAHVMPEHSAVHAALVLTSLGYNRIPVIDDEGYFVGSIGLSSLMKRMFELNDIDADNIDHLKVEDVMDRKNTVLVYPYSKEYLLHQLVDYNFLPVVDEKGLFLGIIPRKQVLKAVNALAHDLEKEFQLVKKENREEQHRL